MTNGLGVARTLALIRAGYPDGVVPGADYVVLVAVLRQHLPVDELVGVAAELIVRGVNPLAGVDLASGIASLAIDSLPQLDVERVAHRLPGLGWPTGRSLPPSEEPNAAS